MNAEEVYTQEDLLPLSIKEDSLIIKETIEEKIKRNQGMNLERLHHKEDHSLSVIKVSF
jgi:hypothetical protein